MTTQRNVFVRRLLPALVVAAVIAGAPAAWSQPSDTTAPAAQDHSVTRQARIQQHLQKRLDRMAERLQITRAQQEAWAAYVNTVQSMVGTKLARPAGEIDAASIARFRAELASERAQKLTQLADATATLQQSLNPDQRKTLDEIVRDAGHGGRRKGYHGHRNTE